jgi:Na+/melibiose symporter-like transporter
LEKLKTTHNTSNLITQNSQLMIIVIIIIVIVIIIIISIIIIILSLSLLRRRIAIKIRTYFYKTNKISIRNLYLNRTILLIIVIVVCYLCIYQAKKNIYINKYGSILFMVY